MRNIYTVCANPIVRNLLRPNVSMVKNCSYISINQYISDFFVAGKMPQKLSNTNMDVVSSILDSKICKEVYQRSWIHNPTVPKRDIMVSMGLSLSDDFYPNSSIKSNRGRFWIRIVTLVSESLYDNKLLTLLP